MEFTRREVIKSFGVGLFTLLSGEPFFRGKNNPAGELDGGLITSEQLREGYYVGVVRRGAIFSKSDDGINFLPMNWTVDAPAWQRFTTQDFPYHVIRTASNGYTEIEDVVDGKKFRAWVRVDELKTLLNNVGNPEQPFSSDQLQAGSWVFPHYSPANLDFFFQDSKGNPDLLGSRVSFRPQQDTPLVLISSKFIDVKEYRGEYHQVLTPDLNLVWFGVDKVAGGRARKDVR